MFSKWFVCVTIFILRPVSLLIKEVQGYNQTDGFIECEEGWNIYGGRCYKMFGIKDRKLNWQDASNSCKSHGGHLATVHSKDVAEFLVFSQILEGNIRAWIGLNDIQSEGNYKWDDGTEFSFSNWNPGEPHGPKTEEEDCVVMLFLVYKGELGEWNDRRCSEELSYICQVDKGKQEKISRNPTFCSSAMGGGWKFGDSCYNIVEKKMNWNDAEKYCQDKYKGHLVKIMNFMTDYALQYIMSNFSTEIWIGIKMKNKFQQQFSSGWYGTYDRLESPRNFINGTCVVRTEYEIWEIVSCTEKHPFMCEVSTACRPVLRSPPEGSKCPDNPNDWRDLGGEYCYFIDTTNVYNWNKSNSECNRRGGSLVSIHSKDEIDALTPFVKYRDTPEKKLKVFTGLYRKSDHENEFVWADGSEMDYTYWSDNEPNNNGKCGVMMITDMKWNAGDCAETQGYICSVRKISPYATGNPADCIDGVKFGTSIGVAVSVLLVTNLLTAVICYFRPWKGKTREKTIVTDIPLQPMPPFQQMDMINRFLGQIPVYDPDEGYEIMD